jgi:hypothetical protein
MRSLVRLVLLLLLVCAAPAVAQQYIPGTGAGGVGSNAGCGAVAGQIWKTDANGVFQCSVDAGAGTGAPTTSQYWIGALDGSLPNAKNLGIFTGLVFNTGGVPTSYAGSNCDDTTQFIATLNGSGVETCRSVTNAHITAGTIAADRLAFTPLISGTTACGGDTTGTYPNCTVIGNAVSNTKLADMPTATFKGRTTAGTGDPEDLTAVQATALLNPFSATLKGLAPSSGGGVVNFLRADGAWAEPAGTGAAPNTAQYWLGASDPALLNARNLGGFTALVLNTAGVPSAYQGTTGAPTNQCLVSINGSGVGTWDQISTAFLDFDPATQAELDAHEADTTAVHGIANTANLVLKDGSVTMDKLVLFDRDASPVANRQLGVTDGRIKVESTGGVEGRYISRDSVETTDAAMIGNDSVALGTKTTGNYVGQLTAGTNITLTNCTPGEGVNCTIASTGGGGGTAATTTFAPTGTIAGTDVQAAVAEVAAEAEQVSRKSVPGATVVNGYVGASTTGRVPWGSIGDTVQHANLAAPTTIVPTAPSMGIQSTGGALISSAAIQIAAGSFPGQRLTTKGTSLTDTFQLNNGNGIRLCGNAGSVVLGLNLDKVEWEWNSVLSVWEEMDCKGLDRIANVGKKITTATSAAAAFEVGSLTDFYRLYATGGKAIMECVSGGGACDTEFTVPATKLGKFFSGTDELVRITESTDTWEFLAGTLALNANVTFAVDAEAANKTITIPSYWDLDLVGVVGGVPSLIWNQDPLGATCTAGSSVGTNRAIGFCTFPDSDGDVGAQISRYLPTGWVGSFDADIWWKTTGTGNARFQIATKCYADDEADDAAFNAASVVTAAAGTSGRPNKQTITGITTTGCAAGELMRIRFFRNRLEASDTLNAGLDVEKIIFKIRVAH